MVVHGKYYKLFIISNDKGLGTRDSGLLDFGISGIKDKSVLSVYVLHVYVGTQVLVCKWNSSNIHWIKTTYNLSYV